MLVEERTGPEAFFGCVADAEGFLAESEVRRKKRAEGGV